jgi:hypothetical protein
MKKGVSYICNFDRYYKKYDNFHILGILPVYRYRENKVNECYIVSEDNSNCRNM